MTVRVVVAPTVTAAGEHAADAVAERLGTTGTSRVVGAATGSSPRPLYRALADRVRRGDLDLTATTAFALDEYVGLPADHPERYRAVVDRDVTGPLGLDPLRVHVPDGLRADPERGAVEYDAAIRAAGGVDVQVLGIGANGHIGFNEPGSAPDSRTRVVALTPTTRAANARFFAAPELVPTHAVTQGVGTISEARAIVLVAGGADKAAAVRAALEGPVTAACPASFLRLHPDVVFCLDEAAASMLEREALLTT